MLTDSGPILLPRPQGRFLYRVCGVAFETASVHPKRRAYTESHAAPTADPPKCAMGRVAVSAHAANDREPRSPSQSRCSEYWSVDELTRRAPASGAAGRGVLERNARICWQTIFICGKSQWYGKTAETARISVSLGNIRRVVGASSVNLAVIITRPWPPGAGRPQLTETALARR